MKIRLINHVILLPLFLVLLNTACGPGTYLSNWNDNSIIVDGNQSDWEGKLSYIEDKRAAVGVFNDSENLFLCLTTDDKDKMILLLNLGMTIWIRPEVNNANTRGIKYPQRSEDFDVRIMRAIIGEVAKENYIRKLLYDFRKKQTDLQIVNEDNYSLYAFKINNGSGIKIKLGMNMQQLVYEISIPMGGNIMNEFNLDLFPGDNLRVRFLTNEYKGPDGEGKWGGITGTGGRTGVPGAGVYGRPEPIDVEVSVTLANSP